VRQREVGLTPREREVLSELVHGKTNKEIARALGVSVPAVAFHLRNIFRKLRVRTRRAAARKYLQLFGKR
jgi:LuxR family maltose regulon positive regulatory protein